MVGCYTLTMPPRTSLTASFLVSDINNEVVCPLRNQDGSGCRKRCLGEKRYRSMQEHIRRAHPENYIPKLPATEESFRLMITTPPSDKFHPASSLQVSPQRLSTSSSYNFSLDDKVADRGSDIKGLLGNSSSPNTPVNTPKIPEEYQPSSSLPAACAAAALAQLHNHKLETDPEPEGVCQIFIPMRPITNRSQDQSSDTETHKHVMRHSIEFSPPNIGAFETRSDTFSPMSRRTELLPSIFAAPQIERSSTLPPIQRIPSLNRPRKDSLTKRAREPQHKRTRSRGESSHLWRMNFDRKAQSIEPSNGLSVAWGKRWEDLIDAATSATKDTDENAIQKSPVIIESRPRKSDELRVSSLISPNHAPLPPVSRNQPYYQRYHATPLQQTLTPPLNQPGPLVENSESGGSLNYKSQGHSITSHTFPSRSIQIYCAACQGLSPLKESYVCTECICGICEACVDTLMVDQGARRKCPKCATIGGRYKKINLDMR